LDISADGGKLLVLTYNAAMEINLDFTNSFPDSRNYKTGTDFSVIELNKLPQQEAIAYLPKKHAFIFTTEFHTKFGQTPINMVTCLD
jgi:hypothetical protein